MDREMLYKTRNQLFHAGKMGAIGQIAADVAHEINNPISFVGTKSANPLQQIVDESLEEIDRIRKIVYDLNEVLSAAGMNF
jgi:two-component system C4-dicarboxylate transport sensor histidine kinase DctB